MERTSNPCDQSDSVDSRGVGRIPPSSVRVTVVVFVQDSPPTAEHNSRAQRNDSPTPSAELTANRLRRDEH